MPRLFAGWEADDCPGSGGASMWTADGFPKVTVPVQGLETLKKRSRVGSRRRSREGRRNGKKK